VSLVNKKNMKIAVFLLILVVASSTLSSLSAARYIISKPKLKSVYYQNEEIEIIAPIMNNDTSELELRSFRILVESAKITGRNATVYINMTIKINKTLNNRESYTIYYKLSLRSLLPDKYNLTVTLEMRYFGETVQEVPLIEDWKFQVKPYIEVPPAAMVVLLIMIGVIILFIGYGIAGRIGRKKK